MPDKEKVIKGMMELHGSKETMDIIRNALALLREQETRLVRHYEKVGLYANTWLHCEKCGGKIDDLMYPKFCPECGRKVIWDVARMLEEGYTLPHVLTLDELRGLPVGAVVWYEQRQSGQTYLMPMVVTADGHIGCWALGVCMDVIGQDDRCWSARPTDEQREATPWRV